MLRALLAVMVAVYYAGGGVIVFGTHIGVAAVVGFFIISGYVMTGLLDRNFPDTSDVGAFYFDRIVRLVPQYAFYALVSTIMIFGFGIRSPDFQGGQMTMIDLIAHITVVPLSAASFIPDVSRFLLIPQPWSLGTEVLFYAIFPFLVFVRRRACTAAALSLAVLLTANTGLIDPDAFGYRMLPGMLVFFLSGHFIYRQDWKALAMTATALTIGAIITGSIYGFDHGYSRSVYVGALIGVTSVLIVRHWSGPIDTALGNVSYGCYLSHLCWIFAFQRYGVFSGEAVPFVVSVTAASLGSGWLTYHAIERHVSAMRKKMRARYAPSRTVDIALTGYKARTGEQTISVA
jgi:peptidoglycan/LPS O-acetylase OafA/YrhL